MATDSHGTSNDGRAPDTSRSATGLLKLLLAGCFLLPLALFVLASWLNYRAAIAEAYRTVERSADVAREHAAKVLTGRARLPTAWPTCCAA